MRISELKNKRILVWGLGKEGQAAIAALCARITAEWLVYCEGHKSQQTTEFLANYPNITVIHKLNGDELFNSIDVIIKSPGVSLYRTELDQARAVGVKITSGTNIWFAENPTAQVIGVTGSKGKSTTSSLLAHILLAQGKTTILAGNIGQPLISFLSTPDSKPDYWVVELSSYQLADFTGKLSAAILLNLYPEHLDWHQTTERYYQDKLNIVNGLRTNAVLVTSKELINCLPSRADIEVLTYNSGQIEITDRSIRLQNNSVTLVPETLPGRHNLLNAAAALQIALTLQIPVDQLLPALTEFKPLPHRLQPVCEINGVLFINDSISTIPESSVAAVSSFASRPLILILGGLQRKQDWAERVETLCQPWVKHIICMGENRTHILLALKAQISKQLPGLHECETLDQAVTLAKHLAPPGAAVLLSPGSASYDQFSSFEERGSKFEQLARISSLT